MIKDVLSLIHGGKQKLEDTYYPLPGAIDAKPGSATKPFFGIKPVLVDNDNNELSGEAEEIYVLRCHGLVK